MSITQEGMPRPVADLTLAEIAASENPTWALRALRSWLAAAGEAVSLAPAAALADVVRDFACRTCPGCEKQIADEWMDSIRAGSLTWCSEECLVERGERAEVRDYFGSDSSFVGDK